ncbi:MAG TPA: metal ABC transporter substrate-binding protein [Vulgatibacter sp.]|nr:metal ABC transporter substrate-binding protein [Vulgatibacter sp.]
MHSRVFAALLALAASTPAAADVRVVASVPALGSIAREVVGDAGRVDVLAPAEQDPHFADGKPSMILALNRADALLFAGLGLETGWLPTLVTASRNPRIQPGSPGSIEATAMVPLLETGGRADRSLGDVHPGGNPHVWLDPRRARTIALGLAERLAALDTERAAAYRANASRFAAELDRRIEAWEKAMAPYAGRSVVPFHKSLVYLTDWLGLKEVATIEPLPGISPSPSHLAGLILRLRDTSPPPLVVSEPWHNLGTAATVAKKAGARFVRLPGDVGSVPGKDGYVAHLDELLARLRAGWEGK